MNVVGTVDSVKVKNGERKIKLIVAGNSDVRETDDCGIPGVDASPIKGMKAIYAQTQVEGEEVIIGYIIDQQQVASGEIKIYSQDDNGTQKFFAHFKKDGTCNFGGDQDNLVRYTGMDASVQKIVQFINQQLPLIAAGIATGGGSYTPGTLSVDTSSAKIEEIKTLKP